MLALRIWHTIAIFDAVDLMCECIRGRRRTRKRRKRERKSICDISFLCVDIVRRPQNNWERVRERPIACEMRATSKTQMHLHWVCVQAWVWLRCECYIRIKPSGMYLERRVAEFPPFAFAAPLRKSIVFLIRIVVLVQPQLASFLHRLCAMCAYGHKRVPYYRPKPIQVNVLLQKWREKNTHSLSRSGKQNEKNCRPQWEQPLNCSNAKMLIIPSKLVSSLTRRGAFASVSIQRTIISFLPLYVPLAFRFFRCY